ncbi:MAG: ABC transporter substrate-binding protein, partial [Alphaproteobacteria bacterium]|nr:ABC transporter substrate-binding protein [Alphaproteobacteria bacterium]
MKRKALIIIGVIAIAVAALFVLRPAHRFSDPRPVVTIGAILPLSGDMAHMGDAIRRAINFAISDINGNPDNRFAYRAIFDDNQHQARQAVSIANKMIARNRVSALVTAFSPSAFATAPLIIQHGLIGLHGTPVHEVLDGVYNFTFFPTPAEITRGLSEFAHSRNPERIALAFQISGTTLELLEGLDGKLPGEVRRFDS